ncbi:hypothetical protein O181_123871, partial [Austropuccinia psidii MF-1]|nr:hypothetical protein [Austropuccinia psidii MF-1]
MSSKLTEITESSPSALPPSVLCGSGVFSQLSSLPWRLLVILIPPKPMMGSEQLKFLILPVLNVWPRVRIAFNITILDCQNAIFASLERSHVVVPGQLCPTSGGIYGAEKMGLLGRNSPFLRNLLLIQPQDFLN